MAGRRYDDQCSGGGECSGDSEGVDQGVEFERGCFLLRTDDFRQRQHGGIGRNTLTRRTPTKPTGWQPVTTKQTIAKMTLAKVGNAAPTTASRVSRGQGSRLKSDVPSGVASARTPMVTPMT